MLKIGTLQTQHQLENKPARSSRHFKTVDWDDLQSHSIQVDSNHVIRRALPYKSGRPSSRKQSSLYENKSIQSTDNSEFKKTRFEASIYQVHSSEPTTDSLQQVQSTQPPNKSPLSTFDLAKKRQMFSGEVRKHFLPHIVTKSPLKQSKPSKWKQSVLEQMQQTKHRLKYSKQLYEVGTKLMHEGSRLSS